jgi:uncharacterized damage-inducible protein DinB
MTAVRDTLDELFLHNDWARDLYLTAAADVPDADLDRPFDMGPGSIRATLVHVWGAEQIWLERLRGAEKPVWQGDERGLPLTEVRSRFEQTARERTDFLAAARRAGLRRRITFRTLKGEPREHAAGDILLHVANHGVHHRAQLANMLRHIGRKPPGLDYLFLRAAHPTLEQSAATRDGLARLGFGPIATPVAPARFEVDTIAEYLRYSDWATARVLTEARGLSDAELDRPFDIGPGSLRKTLLHICDAESWWCDNWRQPGAWRELPADTSLSQLETRIAETIRRRDAFLAAQTDDSLQNEVAPEVRPGVTLRFRRGESLLQLPTHGTHHRAQALNMLRQLGRTAPSLDFVTRLREANAG